MSPDWIDQEAASQPVSDVLAERLARVWPNQQGLHVEDDVRARLQWLSESTETASVFLVVHPSAIDIPEYVQDSEREVLYLLGRMVIERGLALLADPKVRWRLALDDRFPFTVVPGYGRERLYQAYVNVPCLPLRPNPPLPKILPLPPLESL